MISFYMIFTALATTALAKGSIECNFSEPTGAQYFGAVGQLLIFHLPNTANTEVKLTKDNKYHILKIVKNQIVTPNAEYVSHLESFTNGTIKLGNAMKRDSGDYLLEEFGSNGVLLKRVKVHLEIQVPVSKPAVSQICLSPEQMNITCSSEGDGVEFILTLDLGGHSQSPSSWTANMQQLAKKKKDQDKPSVSNVAISLHGQLTGNLMCNVWNNVSRDETLIHLTQCKAVASDFPVAVAARAGVVTLLILALCLCIYHLQKKLRLTIVNEGSKDYAATPDYKAAFPRKLTDS